MIFLSKIRNRMFLPLFVFLLTPMYTFGQGTILGKVTDSKDGEPIVLANIILNDTNLGTTSSNTGKFKIDNIPAGSYQLTISYVGYETVNRKVDISDNKVITINITMNQSEIELSGVLIEANRAKERETPVAFSDLNAEEIQTSLGGRDISMTLSSLPSVYGSETGGGYGDSRINIRGFSQENVAIMINGVPVNDMENSVVYWSNWAGLGDVTANIQVQRGLSASPYSVSSVGGLVNIQTVSTNEKKSSMVRYESGSYNFQKTTAKFSTGLMDNGFAFTGLVSRKTSDGYADRLWIDEFTYFFTLGTRFDNHTLDLTVVGSPQEHGQRTGKQSINSWASRGLDYNGQWGYLNGKKLDQVVNFYHKPAINLNHNWQISDDLLLATIAYASFGTGGGTGGLGTTPARKTDGTLDWDGLWSANVASATGSKGIIRASRNDHNWYGLVTTAKYKLSEEFEFTGGFDTRYYRGIHFREITNLVGGSYYLDSGNLNRDPATKLNVGDKVAYDNEGLVTVGGGFGQLEYKTPQLSAFVNLSGNLTFYKRVDHFLLRDRSKTPANFTGADSVAKYYKYQNSLDPVESDWESFPGYTSKAGVNFNLDEFQNVYINSGVLSKAPLFNTVFKLDNTVYDGVGNEITYALEGGYGLRTNKLAIALNLYVTAWQDKALILRSRDVNGAEFRSYVPGLDALHRGYELEGRYIVNSELEVNGSFSYAINEWANNVEDAEIRNDDGVVIGTTDVYVENLFVGDHPMTIGSLSMTYKTEVNESAEFRFQPTVKYFDRMYANFAPDARSTVASRVNAWKLPSYFLVDVLSAYEIAMQSLGIQTVKLSFNIYNILNTKYIADADDGADHNSVTSTVFYGRERNYIFSIGLNF